MHEREGNEGNGAMRREWRLKGMKVGNNHERRAYRGVHWSYISITKNITRKWMKRWNLLRPRTDIEIRQARLRGAPLDSDPIFLLHIPTGILSPNPFCHINILTDRSINQALGDFVCWFDRRDFHFVWHAGWMDGYAVFLYWLFVFVGTKEFKGEEWQKNKVRGVRYLQGHKVKDEEKRK